MARGRKGYPETPDGRYFVSRGELKRLTNPALEGSQRRQLIKQLMQARMAASRADCDEAFVRERARVSQIKEQLGESGAVWWSDGAPDESHLSPERSSYAEWWKNLSEVERAPGEKMED